jgi:FAD synthetase
LNLFKQARRLAKKPFLIVLVARDKNVFKIKNRKTVYKEKERAKLVEKCKLADKVILGSANNYLINILKEKPNIIALGYDQKVFVKELKDYIKEKNLNIKIVRLKSHKPHIYKNSLLNVSNSKRN